MTPPIVNILNTVTGAADAEILGGKVSFPNVTGVFPVIDYLKIQKSNQVPSVVYTGSNTPVFVSALKRAQKEQPTSIDITIANATLATYKFTIEQNVADGITGVSRLQVIPFSYTTPSATITDAALGTAISNAINGASSLRVTASYSVPVAGTVVITVVAQAVVNGGSAIFTVVPQALASVANTKNADLSNGGATAISAISTATTSTERTVTTSAAHGLVSGQLILLKAAAGAGAATVNNIPYQIEVTTTTAFKLVGSRGGTAVTVASIEAYLLGQEPFGQYADVLQSLVAAGVTTAPITTDQYAQLFLYYASSDNDLLNSARLDENSCILWVNQGSATSSAALPANYLALETDVALILSGGGSAYIAVPAP